MFGHKGELNYITKGEVNYIIKINVTSFFLLFPLNMAAREFKITHTAHVAPLSHLCSFDGGSWGGYARLREGRVCLSWVGAVLSLSSDYKSNMT